MTKRVVLSWAPTGITEHRKVELTNPEKKANVPFIQTSPF